MYKNSNTSYSNTSYSFINDGKIHHINKEYVNLSSSFIDNPSTTHRLDKKVKNNEIKRINEQNKLENMFQKMNI